MDSKILLIGGAAFLWSAWLIVKVLRSNTTNGMKFSAILLLFIPFIGPIMYMFIFEQPPLNQYKYRVRNRGPGSISSYNNYFEQDAKFTKKRIEKLQKRAEENESGQP